MKAYSAIKIKKLQLIAKMWDLTNVDKEAKHKTMHIFIKVHT